MWLLYEHNDTIVTSYTHTHSHVQGLIGHKGDDGFTGLGGEAGDAGPKGNQGPQGQQGAEVRGNIL